MKTTLLVISAVTLALWSGYTIGYLYGAQDSYAKWHSHYSTVEVMTSQRTAMNAAPDLAAMASVYVNSLHPETNTLVIGGH
jgi:hypothetical protein